MATPDDFDGFTEIPPPVGYEQPRSPRLSDLLRSVNPEQFFSAPRIIRWPRLRNSHAQESVPDVPEVEIISRLDARYHLDPDQLMEASRYLLEAAAVVGASAESAAQAVQHFASMGLPVDGYLDASFEASFPNHQTSCTSCAFWVGNRDLPCAVKPLGIEGDDCSDFEAADGG